MICTNQTSCISPSPPGTHFVVQDSGARRVCVSENQTDWLTRVPIVLNVLLAYLEDKLRIWKVGPWRPFFLCWWTKSQLSVFFLRPFLFSIHIKFTSNWNKIWISHPTFQSALNHQRLTTKMLGTVMKGFRILHFLMTAPFGWASNISISW